MTYSEEVDILLVEDDRDTAEMTWQALNRANLVDRLLWLNDGRMAYDFLFRKNRYADRRGKDPRLVILDLHLPGADGLILSGKIKSDATLAHIPVVVFTSSDNEQDRAGCYRAGADSYIVKPSDAVEYREAIVQTGLYWLNKARNTA